MKKVISFALSAALMMSVMSPFASLGYAEEEQTAQSAAVQVEAASEAESQPAQEQDEASAAEPEQPDSEAASEQEAENTPASSAASEEQEAESAAAEEEQPAASASQAESEAASQPEEAASETEKQPEQASSEAEELPEDGIAEFSLRPMKEITDLKLELDGYSREEYKAFSVDDLMGLLKDRDGNKVEIELTKATTVWFRFGDWSDEYREEVHQLNNNETVNLWEYRDYGTREYDGEPANQQVIMVVGSGNQMDDANNTRYVFDETLYTNERPSYIDGELELVSKDQYYNEYRYNKYAHMESNKSTNNFNEMGIYGLEVVFVKEGGYDTSKELYIDWDDNGEKQLQRSGYAVTLYDAESYKADPENAQQVTLTDDRYIPLTGAENKWIIVVRNAEQKVIAQYGISVGLQDRKAISGYFYVNGEDKEQIINLSDYTYYSVFFDWENEENTVRYVSADYSIPSYSLCVNENQEENVYLALKNGEKVKGVYLKSDVNHEQNLKSQFFVEDDAQLPCGYRVPVLENDYNYSLQLDIVIENDAHKYLNVVAYKSGKSDDTRHYSNSFYINCLYNADGSEIDYKSVSSISDMELDSYYSGYNKDVSGYQLIMTSSALTEEQMKALIPSFYTSNDYGSDESKLDKVYSNNQMISGKTSLQDALWLDMDGDGKNETVQFTVVTPDGKSKNYMVTFAVQQEGSSLFVPGPEERLVNLNISNNFAHDVLVMNTGAEDLTIESVTIEDAQNVAIDDYWTIQPDSVLNGLTTTSSEYTYTDEDGVEHTDYNYYASMANMAKIRLIPNGGGVISGTLVIKAANGNERRIKLTGVAALPGFTTDAVTEGVKYVPYAFMVATDNMYAWNEDTFELSSGNLPEGVVLKDSGEIYGTPKEAGEFTFTVKVHHSSDLFAKYPTEQQFTLIVNDNSDINVYSATDEDYEIKQAIGTEKTPGSYDFYLADASKNQIFSSQADYLTYPQYPQSKVYNFKGLWLNGEKLEQGVDYDAQQGSTVITIRSQTFANKANRNGANTIAMEFRVKGSEDNELKRTAQNFYMDANTSFNSGDSHSGTSSSENAESSTGSSSNSTAGTQTTGSSYAEVGGANLTIRVLDANGAVMPGVTVVLHSTPRSTVTDSVGRAYFANVEFGQHTIAVVKNGQTIATSQFVLEKSVNTAVSNGTVYSPDGGDVAFLVHVTNVGTVTLDEGSAVKLAAGTVPSPQTGDDSHLLAWAILLGAAVLSTSVLLIRSKKQ